jgi:DNA-binding XRE family transcriptional regulator
MSRTKDIMQKTETQGWPSDSDLRTEPMSFVTQTSSDTADDEEQPKQAAGRHKEDDSVAASDEAGVARTEKGNGPAPLKNRLREFRIEQMMSKAELARKAGLSVLTIDRIEKGFGCRMDTKRKIIKALGLKLSDRRKLFQEE